MEKVFETRGYENDVSDSQQDGDASSSETSSSESSSSDDNQENNNFNGTENDEDNASDSHSNSIKDIRHIHAGGELNRAEMAGFYVNWFDESGKYNGFLDRNGLGNSRKINSFKNENGLSSNNNNSNNDNNNNNNNHSYNNNKNKNDKSKNINDESNNSKENQSDESHKTNKNEYIKEKISWHNKFLDIYCNDWTEKDYLPTLIEIDRKAPEKDPTKQCDEYNFELPLTINDMETNRPKNLAASIYLGQATRSVSVSSTDLTGFIRAISALGAPINNKNKNSKGC